MSFYEKFDLTILAHGEMRAEPLSENSSGNFEHVSYHFTDLICFDKSFFLRFVGVRSVEVRLVIEIGKNSFLYSVEIMINA